MTEHIEPRPSRLDQIQTALADRATPYADRCDLHLERDKVPCTCGHVCGMHGSFAPDRGFVGIGRGPCGFEALDAWARWQPCPCTQMTEVTAS